MAALKSILEIIIFHYNRWRPQMSKTLIQKLESWYSMNMKDYFGECHCGEIRFKFTSEDSVDIWKCNCSICEIHGFEHLFIKHNNFTILAGSDSITEYTFRTKTAKHLFCKICGVKSFYQPRSHPDSYSINLKCVKQPPQVKNTINFDGKNDFTKSLAKNNWWNQY